MLIGSVYGSIRTPVVAERLIHGCLHQTDISDNVPSHLS